jgi:hypothetical protein
MTSTANSATKNAIIDLPRDLTAEPLFRPVSRISPQASSALPPPQIHHLMPRINEGVHHAQQ